MSDTTDPTAGERLVRNIAKLPQPPGKPWRPPAEPDAGDVEALGLLLVEAIRPRLTWPSQAEDVVQALLASPVLDAVRRKAGSDALTEAAAQWDVYQGEPLYRGDVARSLRARAARIAGESV